MFKIIFAAIGALVGISLDGYLLGLTIATAGFVLGLFADAKRQAGETPTGMPAATQHTTPTAATPAPVRPAAPATELAALRHEVASLKVQVEHLTSKVNALIQGQRPAQQAEAIKAAPQTVSDAELEFQALAATALPEPAATIPKPAAPSATPTPTTRVEVPHTAPYVAPHTAPQPASRPNIAPVPHAPAEAGFNPFAAAWNWLFGGNTLVRVGVVVLFFGLAFLVKYAAENMVFPVEFRYLGIAVGAIVAMLIGWRLRDKRPGYAMAMQGFAVAALYLTVFTAFRLHHLLPGGLAFALLLGICAFSAVLAIAQNAISMAVIGISGGFLAPVLASTGGGSHVALFSYFALLNAGVFAIAWFKAWRPLNVLGFAFTFGIGSAWGQRYYRDELFATTEPFLILFFLFYLAIGLLYMRRRLMELSRHGSLTIAGQPVDYVDGTLVFGVPIAAFGLQYLMVRDMHLGTALSALGLGAIYLPIAIWLAQRKRAEYKLMTESFLALGLIFASLAIPLALDAQWTASSWALEGVGLYWVALRQRRPWVRTFALLLQIGGGLSLLRALSSVGTVSPWFGWQTMLDGPALAAAMVGVAALAIAHLVRRHGESASEAEHSLRPLLQLWGLGFLHLMFPMLLDQRWTAIAITITAAATLLYGLRREEYGALLFGAIVQVAGGLLFAACGFETATQHALLNLHWGGSLLIAAAGLTSATALHRAALRTSQQEQGGLSDAGEFLRVFSVVALGWATAWWWAGMQFEIDAHAGAYALSAQVGLAAATAALLLLIARVLGFAQAQPMALLLLPALYFFAVNAHAQQAHPAEALGWLAWPAAFAMLFVTLRKNDDGPLKPLLTAAHPLAVWLVTGMFTWQFWWWFHELGDPASAWPVLGWVLAPLAALAFISVLEKRESWPAVPHAQAYRYAALPIAGGLWFWVFFANLVSQGNAAPLPYLPIVNPLDLAVGASLLVLLLWVRRTLAAWSRTSEGIRHLTAIVLGATTFFWLNGVLLRSLHHWASVPFDFDVMMASTLVQAALSLFWALIALCLMLFATRRGLRLFWIIGGALMAAVVVKLFLVDLSRVGTIERIVSFIGVGILLLVLGYFSPVPPRRGETS